MSALAGMTAVVTGGGSGLGAAHCVALAAAGATVVVADMNGQTAGSVAASIGGGAWGAELDVTDHDAFAALLHDVVETNGSLDVLVNNAGVSRRTYAIDTSPEDFEFVVAVNMKAVYFGSQSACRLMKERAQGSIINIASIGGYVVDGERSSVYDATKAAVIMMTKSLAYEWARYGVRVNAIAPGYMRTPQTAELLADETMTQRVVDRHIPAGRIGEPGDLAGATVFLASPASSYVTGHTLVVDGGWLTQ